MRLCLFESGSQCVATPNRSEAESFDMQAQLAASSAVPLDDMDIYIEQVVPRPASGSVETVRVRNAGVLPS